MCFFKFLPFCILVCMTFSSVFGDTGLTIYNQNFAVVHDEVSLDLKKGENEIEVTAITAHVEPHSVILRDPSGKRILQILEQNYRSDPVSQNLLLNIYEGQTIDFLVQKQDKQEIVKGKIIRSSYVPHQNAWQQYGNYYYQRQMAYVSGVSGQPIVEIDGKLRFGLPGVPLFPSLSEESILKPTLHWIIESSEGGKFNGELNYVTGGMRWEMDYNVISPYESDILDLVGWVSIDNQSGKTFENSRIKLMAGDVSKIQPQDLNDAYMARSSFEVGNARASQVTEKSFDEYHLYTLKRSTTLRDRETKQVEMIRISGIPSKRVYVYDGAKIDHNRYRGWGWQSIRDDRNYGTISNPKIWVMREFENSKENHLGIPLPKGRARFYRRDQDGQLEFTGENMIDHTAKDEVVRIYTGNAFDLVGERRQTHYETNHSQHWTKETFEIILRNHSDKNAEILVVEHLYRWFNWKIEEPSHTYLKTDSKNIEFSVQVKPDEEKKITYRVYYSW